MRISNMYICVYISISILADSCLVLPTSHTQIQVHQFCFKICIKKQYILAWPSQPSATPTQFHQFSSKTNPLGPPGPCSVGPREGSLLCFSRLRSLKHAVLRTNIFNNKHSGIPFFMIWERSNTHTHTHTHLFCIPLGHKVSFIGIAPFPSCGGTQPFWRLHKQDLYARFAI